VPPQSPLYRFLFLSLSFGPGRPKARISMVDDLIGLLVSFLWRGRPTGPRGRPRGRRPSRPACVRHRRTSSPSYSAQGRRRPNGGGETVATRRPHPILLSESQVGSPRILVVLCFPPLSFSGSFFPVTFTRVHRKNGETSNPMGSQCSCGGMSSPSFCPIFFFTFQLNWPVPPQNRAATLLHVSR